MNLSEVKPGDWIMVTALSDPETRAKAIRLGIYEGAKIYCTLSISKGPVVLQNRLQEIAVGHRLAKNIQVEVLTHKKDGKNGHCRNSRWKNSYGA